MNGFESMHGDRDISKIPESFFAFSKSFFIKKILFFFINIIIKRIYNSIREGKSEILEFI